MSQEPARHPTLRVAFALLLFFGLGTPNRSAEPPSPPPPAPAIFAATDDAETAFLKITGFQFLSDRTDFDLTTAAGRQAHIRHLWHQCMEVFQVRLACLDFYARFPDSPRYVELRNWENFQPMISDESLWFRFKVASGWSRTDSEKDTRLSEGLRTIIALRSADIRAAANAQFLARPTKEAVRAGILGVLAQYPSSDEVRQALFRSYLDTPGEKEVAELRRRFPEDTEIAAFTSLLQSINKPCDFEFTALDGRRVRSSDYRGKVVLLEFWAKWCSPCLASIPDLKKLESQYGPKGFVIVGINLDKDRADAENIIKTHELPWPQYFDGKGWNSVMAQRFFVSSIPRGVMIDRQGNLRSLDSDIRLPETKLLIETLLAEAMPPAGNQP
jgi:thiol-disulfide isomerase/thioredoxin